jgi:polyphenol oxidase
MRPWIKVDWPAPLTIHAYVTTQQTGNIAHHVDDDSHNVSANRDALQSGLACPPLAWLHQTHSNIVVNLDKGDERNADGAFLTTSRQTAVVMTADCLPVLLCNASGSAVAAVHCGWRGLSSGIIEAAIKQFKAPPDQIFAWLGPAISALHYEVDDVVRDAFPNEMYDSNCFEHNPRGRWQASLVNIATAQLNRLGVAQVYGGDKCTYEEENTYYSYRRNSKTGRFASLIWIA